MGDLPDGWSEVAFANAIDFQEGPGIMARDFRDAGVPLVRLSGLGHTASVLDGCNYLEPEMVAKRWSHFAMREGDTLLSTSASLGRVARVGSEAIGAIPYTGIIRMRPVDDQVDGDFVKYLLASPHFQRQAEAMGAGSVMRHFGPSHLRTMTLVIPALAEQRAIADVLGALDDKIESNRRLQDTLLDLATAEYDRTVHDVALVSYERALELDSGSPFRSASFSDPGSGRPLVRIRDLKSFEPQVWTTEQREDEHVVHPGDVLVGMDAEFRSVIWCGPTGVLNQRVCRFRPRAGVARVFALLGIRDDLRFFERAKGGTTVIHLNKADIERFEVPNLSVRQHEALAQLTDPVLDRLVAASHESRQLSHLRDTLLPELLSGRLRVDDAVERGEAAT